MSTLISLLLLLLFAAHLLGFLLLALRRREWYYLALVLTFTLLTASFAAALFAPGWAVAGAPLFRLLRYAAWVSAAASISWTLRRLAQRRRARAARRAGAAPEAGGLDVEAS